MLFKRGWERCAARVVLLLLVAALASVLAPVARADQPIPTSTPAVSPGVYTVQPGDTLYSIAKKHGVTVDDLLAWNNIPNPSQIKVGQKIVIVESAIGAAGVETSLQDTSVGIQGESVSWSMPIRTIVIFGAIFLVLIVLLSVVDRIRK